MARPSHQHYRYARARGLHRRGRAQPARPRRRGRRVRLGRRRPAAVRDGLAPGRQATSVPRIAFINKMDRTGADFFAAVQSMVDRLGAKPVPIQLPIGQEEHHRGVVDLVEMRAITYVDDLGTKMEIERDPRRAGGAGAGVPPPADRRGRRPRRRADGDVPPRRVGRHAGDAEARAPRGDPRRLGHAGAARLRLQEQGRPAAARRGRSTTCRARSTCRRSTASTRAPSTSSRARPRRTSRSPRSPSRSCPTRTSGS